MKKKDGFNVVFVGKQDVIEEILKPLSYDKDRVEIVQASEVITCEEEPTMAIRKKPDSSICVALKTLKEDPDAKIDLKNATLVEEIRVNSAPDSIVVDKRNNIIISKEQNQHVSIDYLDMKTKEISIMCYGYYGDELIYNEQDDMVMIVSKASTTDPNIYKYNEESETFELFEMFYELNPLVMAPDIFGRNGNSFIYGSQLYTKAYAEFINGEAQAKKIDIINQKLSWSALYEVCITDNNLVIMQYCPIDLKAGTSFCYITVYDRETTKYQTYQKITNYNGNQLGGIYMYNGNIYVFDKKLGKILVTN